MKKQFITICLIAGVMAAKAQTNFSGTWAEPRLEMIEGIQYSNALPVKIIVSQTKDSIKIEYTDAGADVAPYTQIFALNGKVFERIGKSSKRTFRSTATWSADKKTLTIGTTYSYADKPGEVEFNNTETWSLDADGSLVIIKKSDATVTDDWIIKGSFKKQG